MKTLAYFYHLAAIFIKFSSIPRMEMCDCVIAVSVQVHRRSHEPHQTLSICFRSGRISTCLPKSSLPLDWNPPSRGVHGKRNSFSTLSAGEISTHLHSRRSPENDFAFVAISAVRSSSNERAERNERRRSEFPKKLLRTRRRNVRRGVSYAPLPSQ